MPMARSVSMQSSSTFIPSPVTQDDHSWAKQLVAGFAQPNSNGLSYKEATDALNHVCQGGVPNATPGLVKALLDNGADVLHKRRKSSSFLKKLRDRDQEDIRSRLVEDAARNCPAGILLRAQEISRKQTKGAKIKLNQHNLARACEDGGEHERATALYLKAAQPTERSLGPENAEQHRILANMALLLGDGGQVEAAGKLLQEILVLQISLLGQKSPDTLSTACSLALNLRLRGRHAESAKLFKSTWEMQSKVLGKTHRNTLKTKAMLDELNRESFPPKQ
ncbi:hypothetical protein PG994_002404 [Apiospora phragmitis]|uniref:Uncharacterized protein n=1 Tax=Apiospora phragmitis TaxID=2905665 RepID=A0ABR1WW85_9PEZI